MTAVASESEPSSRPFFDEAEFDDGKSIKSKGDDEDDVGYSDNEATPLFTYDPESEAGVAQIPRLEPALALDPSSVTEQATVMVMRKSWKQWSGGDSTFLDTAGNVLYSCDCKANFSKDKTIKDKDGQEVYTMTTGKWSGRRTTTVTNAAGEDVLKCEMKSWRKWNSGRAEIIDPVTGLSRVIRIECRLMKARCLFTLDGQFVASFKRGDRWYKEAYEVTIAPGVDVSLAMLLSNFFESIYYEMVAAIAISV